jgi:hypothetical protein
MAPNIGALQDQQVQALYKEKYRQVVADLFEAEDNVCSMIESKSDVEVIGPRGIRAAKKMRQGGQVRTFNPDGGNLGRGTGAEFVYTTLTPIPLLIAMEKTKAAAWYTATDDIAIRNAVRDQLKDGTREYKANLDRYLMGDGTGVMASFDGVTTVNSATATFASPMGTRWLRDGQAYGVYDSTLATKRATEVTVLQKDDPNHSATFTASLGGVAAITNTDVLVPSGCSGANPQWYCGFRYHFTDARTGLWHGVNRATWPQVRSVGVAASGPIVPSYVRNLKNRMLMFRENCFSKGRWQFVWHPAQAEAYENYALTQVHYHKQSKDHSGVEIMFDSQNMTVDGMSTLTTANQRTDIIDLTNWDNWWRGETIPFGLYTVDDVSTFPVYDVSGTGGGLAAADITYMAQIMQYSVDDPGLGGFISGLQVPTGYFGF